MEKSAKSRYLTYEESEKIWKQYKNISPKVDFKKRLYYIAASWGRSESTIKRCIMAYEAAEKGEQPNSYSAPINSFARKHFGLDESTATEAKAEIDSACLQTLCEMVKEVIARLNSIEERAKKKKFWK